MEAVFLKLVNMSIAAGWLILAVVALRFLLRKAPSYISCMLWGVVGLRLICPFSFQSLFSLVPSAQTVSPDILYSPAPTIQSGIPIVNQAVNPVISQSFAPAVDASVNPMQVILSAASILWFVGMVALLLYSVISYVRLHRRVRTAVLLGDNIWQSEAIPSPFVLGVLRPRIYLPFGMDEESMSHVIAHEKAHIQRHDHWSKPIGFKLLAVYWFHPLVWLAYILLCRDIELACDEKVIKGLDAEDKKAYSKALLSCAVPQRMIAACPLAFGEVGVKARIQHVLHYKKPGFWIIAVAVIACVGVAVCFLTDPKERGTSSVSFGYSLSVDEVAYRYPQDSTPSLAESDQLRYGLTEDYTLTCIEDGSTVLTLGTMTELALTKDNFDGYFQGDGWRKDISAEELRASNQTAWQVIVSDGPNSVFYYVLQQENGDLYLTYGHYDTDGQGNGTSDQSSISLLFKLRPAGVDWVNTPVLNSHPPAFPFHFNLDYTRLEAKCVNGMLIDYDGKGGTSHPQGKSLTLPAGRAVYWSPTEEEPASETTTSGGVFFTLYDGDKVIYMGVVDIYGTKVSDGTINYNAILMEGEGLMLVPSSSGGGATIQSVGWPQQTIIAQADLDGDGAQESIAVIQYDDEMRYALRVLKEDGTQLFNEDMATAHTEWSSLFLCTIDGTEYLLRYNPSNFQGRCSYHFEMFTLENGEENIHLSNTVEFDLNDTEPFDVGEMTWFAANMHFLLEKSVLLLSTEEGVVEIGPASVENYLDAYRTVFSSYDESIMAETALIRIAQLYSDMYVAGISASTSSTIAQIDSSAFGDIPLLDVEYDADLPLYQVTFTMEEDSSPESAVLLLDSHGVVFGHQMVYRS